LYTNDDFFKEAGNYSEGSIMIRHRLTAEQEQEAKQLEAKIRLAIDQEISALARLLISKGESELFGQTEFQIRELVLHVGAKAFEEHLREKKMAIEVPR
jgi:hypothetical protein